MKRCPECRRDYYDDSLMYCLDDGNALLEGPAAADISALPTIVTSHPQGEPTVAFSRDRETTPTLPSTTGTSWRAAAIGVGALLAIGAATYFLYFRPSAGQKARQMNSVAVMPFMNEQGNSDIDYLSDGISETLITSLSQIPGLNVKARTAVSRYKGREISVHDMAQQLAVDAVLTGKLRSNGTDVTLGVELIDGATENILWTTSYTRPMSNLAALQAEIGRDVLRNLRSTPSAQSDQLLTKALSKDPQAYELYLRARHLLNKRSDLNKAIDYFQQAADRDPSFAYAYEGMADAYTQLSYHVGTPPSEAFPKARAAVDKALAIDPDLPAARGVLANIKFYYEWDFEGALNDFRRAVTLAPEDGDMHTTFGECLMLMAKYDEGLSEMKRAVEIDPASVLYGRNLGWAYNIARQPDKAVEQLQKTREMDTGDHMTLFYLGMAHEQQGKFAEALDEYSRSAQISGGHPGTTGIGHLYGATDRKAEALSVVNGILKERAAHGSATSAVSLAIIYAGMRENDKAFEWLQKAFDEHVEGAIYLRCQPYFDPIRSDPRYRPMLRKIGLPDDPPKP